MTDRQRNFSLTEVWANYLNRYDVLTKLALFVVSIAAVVPLAAVVGLNITPALVWSNVVTVLLMHTLMNFLLAGLENGKLSKDIHKGTFANLRAPANTKILPLLLTVGATMLLVSYIQLTGFLTGPMFWLGLGLALSTPVFALVKHRYPEAKLIHWMGYGVVAAPVLLLPFMLENSWALWQVTMPFPYLLAIPLILGGLFAFFRSKPHVCKLGEGEGVAVHSHGSKDTKTTSLLGRVFNFFRLAQGSKQTEKTPPQPDIVFRMQKTLGRGKGRPLANKAGKFTLEKGFKACVMKMGSILHFLVHNCSSFTVELARTKMREFLNRKPKFNNRSIALEHYRVACALWSRTLELEPVIPVSDLSQYNEKLSPFLKNQEVKFQPLSAGTTKERLTQYLQKERETPLTL